MLIFIVVFTLLNFLLFILHFLILHIKTQYKQFINTYELQIKALKQLIKELEKLENNVFYPNKYDIIKSPKAILFLKLYIDDEGTKSINTKIIFENGKYKLDPKYQEKLPEKDKDDKEFDSLEELIEEIRLECN